jgi:hypothetical protein
MQNKDSGIQSVIYRSNIKKRTQQQFSISVCDFPKILLAKLEPALIFSNAVTTRKIVMTDQTKKNAPC